MPPSTNKNPVQSQPEAHKGTSEPFGPVIGPKYRLQTLNRLQAAPGGKQRPLVHQFLTVRGWIKADQEPEDWDLSHLPKSAEEFVALGESIKAFEREMLEGRTTT